MTDDWRIRIEAEDVHDRLLERLGIELDDEARELARALAYKRLAVSRDGDEVFVYTSSYPDALRALAVVEAVLKQTGLAATTSRIEHWLDAEDRWDSDPPGETWEEEVLDRGYAPWEVRMSCASQAEARSLAGRLEGEGLAPVQHFTFVIVGTATREEADALAARLHGRVEAGGEVVYETLPGNPFAVFGGPGIA
jgi:hypothetical protein